MEWDHRAPPRRCPSESQSFCLPSTTPSLAGVRSCVTMHAHTSCVGQHRTVATPSLAGIRSVSQRMPLLAPRVLASTARSQCDSPSLTISDVPVYKSRPGASALQSKQLRPLPGGSTRPVLNSALDRPVFSEPRLVESLNLNLRLVFAVFATCFLRRLLLSMRAPLL